jgi:hypothetical protein
MPLTGTEPPDETPKARTLAALGWGLACAACAGGVSLDVFLMTGGRIELPNAALKYRLPDIAVAIALAGAFGGVLGAALVGLMYPPAHRTPRLLARIGVLTGTFGGALTVPAIILCRDWISPLASSTLLWCLVGFVAGLRAHRLSLRSTEPLSEEGGHGPYAPRFSDWVVVRLFPALALLGLVCWVIITVRTTRY